MGAVWFEILGCFFAVFAGIAAWSFWQGNPLRRFKRSVRSLDGIVIVTNPDGLVTHLNPAAQRLLGYGDSEATLRRADLGNFTNEQGEQSFIRRDGSKLPAAVTHGTITSASGSVLARFEVGIDVTALKAKEEVLLEKQALVDSIALTSPT